MTDDELDKAHKEGKQIQWQPKDWPPEEWADIPKDVHKIKWNVPHVIYRVKPEPPKPKLPRQWIVYTDDRGMLQNDPMGYNDKLFIVREVIE